MTPLGASSAGPASRDPGLGWGPSVQQGASEVSGWGCPKGWTVFSGALPGSLDAALTLLDGHPRTTGREDVGLALGWWSLPPWWEKTEGASPGHPVAPQWLLLSLEPTDQI